MSCSRFNPYVCEQCEKGYLFMNESTCSFCEPDGCIKCIDGDPTTCEMCSQNYIMLDESNSTVNNTIN